MDLEKRIIAFKKLGDSLHDGKNKAFDDVIYNASKKNGWFTEENIRLAIGSLAEMLQEDKLERWISTYKKWNTKTNKPQKVGVIMAGNIPLVGFHDFLCVLMSGNIIVGKLSSDDDILLPAVAKILTKIEPGFKERIHFTNQPFNKTPGISAFIATGSNNSARYFEYYFKKYPHIIRKNRNSVAVLGGKETTEELKNLGKDIFQYFGMGCRNVSKIYIPKDYNLDNFFSAIVDFGDVIHNNKYYNNYQYYRTIYLLNKEKFLDNNFLILKESEEFASPVATLYYEQYPPGGLVKKIEDSEDQIQCVATPCPAFLFEEGGKLIEFGTAQSPQLWDYADGVDTMAFLHGLK